MKHDRGKGCTVILKTTAHHMILLNEIKQFFTSYFIHNCLGACTNFNQDLSVGTH